MSYYIKDNGIEKSIHMILKISKNHILNNNGDIYILSSYCTRKKKKQMTLGIITIRKNIVNILERILTNGAGNGLN